MGVGRVVKCSPTSVIHQTRFPAGYTRDDQMNGRNALTVFAFDRPAVLSEFLLQLTPGNSNPRKLEPPANSK